MSHEANLGRALRVMFVANDGLSAGHVARSLAIAAALEDRAQARGVDVRALLATTSEAHALLADAAAAVVRLPTPVAARRAGFSDAERRRLVRGTIEGIAESFAPDLLIVDTFPSGPHGELAGLRHVASLAGRRRVLVRRSVPDARSEDEALTSGMDAYDLAIVASDPAPITTNLPIPAVVVPPITMARATLARDEARARLGLPRDGRVLLVTAGGGGDAEALDRAADFARAIAALEHDTIVAVARGPLAPIAALEHARIRAIDVAPLEPLLAAFDGAFAAAGYNTAHALAAAGVPAALFARPRAFDDQAARADRFERAGLARAIRETDGDAIADALRWLADAPRPRLDANGADRAAELLLDLVGSSRAP